MTCFYASLESEALLHLSGPDALSFLQGQVTCDTRKLTESAALPGLYCTVQGRVICDFVLCRLPGDHLLLRLRRDIREASAALLAKYMIFSKARLEPARDDWTVLACWGEGAAATLQGVFGTCPTAQYAVSGGSGFSLVQIDAAGQQFECYLQRAAAELLDRLAASAQPAAETTWQQLQIERGIARIEAATAGEFIPQMLNYDVTGHISFNKGCYTGQEVVARMHYRGKPKRRLYLASALVGTPLPETGEPLYAATGNQSVGTVVNSVVAPDGRPVLLVSATRDGLEAGLHLQDPAGPLLATGPLPYAVPEK